MNCHRVCKVWNRLLSSESLHQKAKTLLSHNSHRLQLALTEGNANKLERILKNGMVDVNDEDGLHKMTAGTRAPNMNLASYRGYKDVVQLLLKAGADAQLLCRILPLGPVGNAIRPQVQMYLSLCKSYFAMNCNLPFKWQECLHLSTWYVCLSLWYYHDHNKPTKIYS